MFEFISVAEQEPAHREHHRLPQHHGERVQSHVGNAVSRVRLHRFTSSGSCFERAPLRPRQGIPQPLHQREHGVLLPQGHGRGDHPLRLRSSCRSFRQVL